MNFVVNYTRPSTQGKLVYVASDYAFDFISPTRPNAENAIVLNTLQLAVDEELRVLYPWGYCPLLRFTATDHLPPPTRIGMLLVQPVDEFVPGVAVPLKCESGWTVAINRQEGWVCIGDPVSPHLHDAVEFASSAVAVLSEGKLLALWLQPANLPPNAQS